MCLVQRRGEAPHTTWKETTGLSFSQRLETVERGFTNGEMTEVKGKQFRVEEKFRTLNHIKNVFRNILYLSLLVHSKLPLITC